jgi:hypothetical protein
VPKGPFVPTVEAKPPRGESAWDAALDFIKESGTTIHCDGGRYVVASLSEPHAAALRNFRHEKRTQGRLRALFDIQENEVKRLIAALEKHGRDDQGLVLKDREDGQRVAVLGPEMKRVEGLWKKRRRHPSVKAWLAMEYEQREALNHARNMEEMNRRMGRSR